MCNKHRQLSIGARVPPFYWLFAIVLGALLAAAARASGQPTSPPRQPVLHLANGRSTAGEIRASTQPGVLRWQAASSGSPPDFAWNEVNSIEWPPAAAQPKPTGDFCFELAAGDILFGSLLALGDRAGRAGRTAAGPHPRSTIQPLSHLPIARRRRFDLSRSERPGRLAGADGPEELARGFGPADDRPQKCVDSRRFRASRSRQHRVRDLLEVQAGLRLRSGRQ